MRRKLLGLIVSVSVVGLVGCQQAEPPQDVQPQTQQAPQQTATPSQGSQPSGQNVEAARQQNAPQLIAPQRSTTQGSANADGAATGSEPDMVREKARRGMGKKGQGYGGGIVTQPVSTYFQVRDRIAFEVQIPHAMNIYKAMNGHFPKDMDEFMEQIVKPARIALPELPEGHRYVYDPQKGELQIEHPR